MSRILIIIFSIAVTAVFVAPGFAQTTSFVYQGKLHDGGVAATGTYQFQFKLYDASSGGSQVGQTLADVPAAVNGGVFAVNLDFGAAAFSGAARFLEIAVRLNGSGQPYTVLNPRQPISSAPYAVKSLNANDAEHAQTADDAGALGGVPAAQFVVTSDPRMNDSRNPLPNSGYYIQNSQNQQTASNFNISGEGKADKLTAGSQFNIGAARVLTAGNGSVFVGFGAGTAGAIGGLNTFVGNNAGMNTTNGTRNTFAGAGAGIQNTIGNDNSYFGSGSGLTNQGGDNNSFFGSSAGNLNTADNNSFFGANAGKVTAGGDSNSFFGADSGKANTSGVKNSFFGRNAGLANTTGNFNAFFGSASGQNNTTGIGNSFFGDTSGLLNSTGGNNAFFGKGAGLISTTGSNNVFVGYSTGINNTTGSNNTLLGANAQVNGNPTFATAIGAGAVVQSSNLIVLGRDQGQDGVWIWGSTVALGGITLGSMASGSTHLCGGGGSGAEIGFCSSSIRYKTNVLDFARGLDLIQKLRPVTFDWKQDGKHDLGLIAEEVNQVEPLLNVYRPSGEIEGVKYDQITIVLVNAVKEQQAQLKAQQRQIDALKAIVCTANPAAPVCKSDEIRGGLER
jgi:hypothetical protein